MVRLSTFRLSTFKIDTYAKAALLIAAIFVAYKVWKAGSWVSDKVGGAVDAVVSAVSGAASAAGDVITGATAGEVLEACRAALKAKGQNPDDYYMMWPQPTPGQKLPPGSWVVKYKGKNYYFAKKGASPLFTL